MSGTSEIRAKGISRRKFLGAAGALGAGVAAGGVLSRPSPGFATAGNPTRIRLSWTEFAACH
jgi:NitT/TauT family transport system substrate-binding protein